MIAPRFRTNVKLCSQITVCVRNYSHCCSLFIFILFVQPFSPLAIISTFLWVIIQHLVPILSDFRHVRCHMKYIVPGSKDQKDSID